MTTIQAGEFWVANIPFTNGLGSKKRPVLVLWLDANDAVVAAVTSASPGSAMDVALADRKASGLRAPSTVRLSRLDCLERSLFIARIGKISPNDAKTVRHVWSTHIKPQF